MHSVQLLSIYILKGLTGFKILTIVPIGQYIVQWTIFFLLREKTTIIPIPATPNPRARRVAVRCGTLNHLKIIAAAITIMRKDALNTVLFLRISLVVFPLEARLSNAPK